MRPRSDMQQVDTTLGLAGKLGYLGDFNVRGYSRITEENIAEYGPKEARHALAVVLLLHYFGHTS